MRYGPRMHGLRTQFNLALPRALAVALTALALMLSCVGAAQGATPLQGFQQSTAFSGLTEPMSIAFASNGRVFVAEKSGIIKTYSSLSDTTATEVADLRTNVHNYWDRGLMSIAVDPNYATNPYIYVYYVYDAAIGGTAPRWGSPGVTSDGCPTPPGPNADGCVVSGRISRIQVSGEVQTGPEQVLINDWCQQYPSHAGGGLEFGTDGMLYYSGGDGSSFTFDDYGQDGNPLNPCGDPPTGAGTQLSPPTAEGGRLRAQDIRTSGANDPLGLSGAVIRIDPATGAGVPGNPLFSSPDPQERKFLAFGARNPFRLAIRPGVGDVWVADVGAGQWEEFDRVPSPFGSNLNFGWPCYEGGLNSSGNPTSIRFSAMDNLNLNLCESLYSQGSGAVVPPYWAYRHNTKIVAGETCDETAGSALSGIAFAPANSAFPDAYDGALFWADHSRQCLWVMRADANGNPDPATRQNFVQAAGGPVDIAFGPDGNLYYVDLEAGAIRKVSFTGNANNNAPTAVATANPQSGSPPLTVNFSGTGSSDPDQNDVLTYAWDLDGDGQLDDSTSSTPSFTYMSPGNYHVTLRVTDTSGAFDEDTLTINAGSGTPSPTINTPAAGTTWGVNQTINFSGSATDPEDGALPASALDWQLIINHCTAPGNCHQHEIQTFDNTASGSFVAPDHEYPSTLELRLTATDTNNNSVTVSRQLDPRTVQLTVSSDPPGMQVSAGANSGAAPITSTVIEGSQNTISTPSPQIKDNTTQNFLGWSDGQAQTHNAAPTVNTTYTAWFEPQTPGTSTLTYNAEADALVKSVPPTGNDGAFDQLRTDGSPLEQSYLRFIVGGVAGKVTNAKLRLRSTENGTVDGPELRGTSNAWTEMGITWENKPAATTGAVADAGAIDPGQWIEWDVTNLISANGTYSFQLASTDPDGVAFRSREFSNVALRPELVLTVLNDAYPRAKGATPTRVSLVPAFNACATPNETHGPPLANPSCNPPSQTSPNLTVGSPDANNFPANSSGFVTYNVIPGTPSTPEDEADVSLSFSLTDVRNRVGLTDYAGELQVRPGVRITDRANGPAANEPGTVGDLDVPVNATCTTTADPDTGSTCGVTTTLDALTPGLVDEGARALWELRRVEVMDGGPDGDADTADNTVFARQGIFIP